MGHKIDQSAIRPFQGRLQAITKSNIPKKEKEMSAFFRAIQYLSEYIENLSAQTDMLRKLLKKSTSQFKKRQLFNNRRKHEIPESDTLAKTKKET